MSNAEVIRFWVLDVECWMFSRFKIFQAEWELAIGDQKVSAKETARERLAQIQLSRYSLSRTHGDRHKSSTLKINSFHSLRKRMTNASNAEFSDANQFYADNLSARIQVHGNNASAGLVI
jgi:CRISPR type IV-associated protein Csf3